MSALRVALLALLLAGCGTATEETPATSDPPTSDLTTSDPASGAEPPEGEPTAGRPATSPEPGASTEAASARPSALDTATACARAHPCCEAFVATVDDPVEIERARIACEQLDHLEQLGDAAGEACLAAIDGWRRALELDGHEVPTACR